MYELPLVLVYIQDTFFSITRIGINNSIMNTCKHCICLGSDRLNILRYIRINNTGDFLFSGGDGLNMPVDKSGDTAGSGMPTNRRIKQMR